jgi:hypothetical protein
MPTIRVRPHLNSPLSGDARTPTVKPQAPAQAPTTPADTFETPREFPTSPDGTRIYSQGDPAWRKRVLGRNLTISQAGCAMTSTAMAIGKISGKPITPAELDEYLDANHGYAGDSLDWTKAAAARDLTPTREKWKLSTIDDNLAAGKPCVIGVDYKEGSGGGPNGTDHWICLVSKQTDERGHTYYLANDPGTGKTIRLTPNAKGALVGDGKGALGKYKTTGTLVTFK